MDYPGCGLAAQRVQRPERRRARIVVGRDQQHVDIDRVRDTDEQKTLDAGEIVDAGNDQGRAAERLAVGSVGRRLANCVFVVRAAIFDGRHDVVPGAEDGANVAIRQVIRRERRLAQVGERAQKCRGETRRVWI